MASLPGAEGVAAVAAEAEKEERPEPAVVQPVAREAVAGEAADEEEGQREQQQQQEEEEQEENDDDLLNPTPHVKKRPRPALNIKAIMKNSKRGTPSARILVQPAKKKAKKADKKQEPARLPEAAPPAPPPPPAAPPRPAAARMKMVNGRLVLDQESLVVAAARKEPTRYNNVYETNPRTTSSSFSRRTKVEKWTDDDTRLFYRGLSQFGTDFSMLAQLFPARDRKQLKNKFKVEERCNLLKVEMALRERKPIDMEEFEERLEEGKRVREEKKRREE